MQSTEKETWKPIDGYEGLYEVSDRGRVKSLQRTVIRANGSGYTVREKILKPRPSQSGHMRVSLYRDGQDETRFVHRLVLEAFVGPRPDGMECCHWDDVPANNHLDNLRWDTGSANQWDKVRNGNHHQLHKTHCSRGHLLADPNLRESAKPYRICRACQAAHAFCHYRGIPITQEIADQKYRQFMTGIVE